MALHTWAPRALAAATASCTALALVAAPAQAAETDAPKNIIYMIGDGMGYNHVAATNLYETGQSRYQLNGANKLDEIKELEGKPVQTFESWNELALTSFQLGNSYDKVKAWEDREWINKSPTDSAAAGTAMATGKKTMNGMLGVDAYGNTLENASERAIANGKSAGVVSSVPFSHATPAAWASHNPKRSDYHGVAAEMIASDLDVIMGAGHPYFDDDSQPVTDPNFKKTYISKESYDQLANGDTDWRFITEQDDFKSLAQGVAAGDDKVFGLAKVGSTLQQARSGSDGEEKANVGPFVTEFNAGVPDLATMSLGALNVLNQNDNGFHIMIEGGAIDWTGHANTIGRSIEETIDFNKAVEAVEDWVEKNSSWDETLLIVTADHETGYLAGPNDMAEYTALTGTEKGKPEHKYYSNNHTNQLVPFYFKGAGSADIKAAVVDTDQVRGDYIDNTTVARLTLDKWWTAKSDDKDDKPKGSADGSADKDKNDDAKQDSDASSLTPGGIAAIVIAVLAALAGIAAFVAPQVQNFLPKF